MRIEIPRLIDSNEIIVRYVFLSNFKNKILSPDKIIEKDIFFDSRGGVSMQRHSYCNENECKRRAKDNQNVYKGFVIFTKKTFDEVLIKHKNDNRHEFLAELTSSPLDENNNPVAPNKKIFTDSIGNPSHSDLIYINPAVREEDAGNPKIAIRVFSRRFFKSCKLIIDSEPDELNYCGTSFEKLLS